MFFVSLSWFTAGDTNIVLCCSILPMVQDPRIQLIQYVPDRTSFDSDFQFDLLYSRLMIMSTQAAPIQMIQCVTHCSSF